MFANWLLLFGKIKISIHEDYECQLATSYYVLTSYVVVLCYRHIRTIAAAHIKISEWRAFAVFMIYEDPKSLT